MAGHFANLVRPMTSRTVQPVFTPASEAMSVGASHAGQRMVLTPRSARSAAAAVDCTVKPDKVARFEPPAGVPRRTGGPVLNVAR